MKDTRRNREAGSLARMICNTCGNEIPDRGDCPFCGNFQHATPSGRPKRKRRVVTVNLEQGRPSTDEAIARLDLELAAARMKGVILIRIIHGWGSSGTGGKIKTAVRSHLKSLQRAARLRSITAGEEFSDRTNRGRDLLNAHPTLRSSLKTDSENPGITFVEV